MDKEDPRGVPKELEALRRKYDALDRRYKTLRLAAVETLDAWDKAESTARLVVSIKRLRTAVG